MKMPDAKAWVRIVLSLLLIAGATYMILIPSLEAALAFYSDKPKKIVQLQGDMTFGEQIRFRTIEAMTAFWFFAFGAAIGSFLNVVVYRLPRGESLAFQRSHCPKCGVQIAGKDNIPILGWLMLGGRCRSCGCEISLRYPTVELTVGLCFLTLYFVELISGGYNLPLRRPNDYAGVVWIVFYTKWDLVTIYLFHCAMFSLLLVLALVELDRNRLPFKTMVALAIMLAIPACVFPHLLLVKQASVGGGGSSHFQALMTTLVGAFTGGIAGTIVAKVVSRLARTREIHFPMCLVIVGVCLGWQAVIPTVAITMFLKFIMTFLPNRTASHPLPLDQSMTDLMAGSEAADTSEIGNRMLGKLVVLLSMYLFIAAMIHQVAWRWVFNALQLGFSV